MAASTRWTGLALLLLLAPTARAQDVPPQAQLDTEARIISSLADAINTGVALFNAPKNDHIGCYRIYQGALKAILPLLSHRPDLQRSVLDKLQKAESQATPSDQAFTLRSAIDDIRVTLHKDQPKPAGSTKTLWDRLGGELAVKAVIDEFVDKAAPDPAVDFFRGGRYTPDVPKLKQLLVEFVSKAAGGPLRYSGREMAPVHTNMLITDAQFDALAGHLLAALKKFDVPEKETKELMDAVGGTRKDIVGK